MSSDSTLSSDSNEFDARFALVLDDEAAVGVALCKSLAVIGIDARHFVRVDEFISDLEQCDPDLVFLDLALGQSDAIEVIHQLEIRKFKGRVILISGRDSMTLLEVERIGRAHGLFLLPSLPKPFTIADIKDRLQPCPPLQPEDPEAWTAPMTSRAR